MIEDHEITLFDLANNCRSTLPRHEYKESEWIWLEGHWIRARAGGFRQHALLEHEARLLGLSPPQPQEAKDKK